MNRASQPPGEEGRLRELRACQSAGPAWDDAVLSLVRVAARVCGTPMAFVSFVDESRQWFVASVGLDLRETPRESSFCAHTILCVDSFEVKDAALDPRFANNPLVVGPPHIRFYSGAPVVVRGFALGALAVAGRAPGQLTPEQASTLRDLAKGVAALLHARRGEAAEAARERAFLSTVLENMPNSAVFVFDEEQRVERVFGNAALAGAGMTVADYVGKRIRDFALPENAESLALAAARCLHGERTRADVTRGGRRFEVAFMQLEGRAGEPPRGLAISYDITEPTQLRERIAKQERLVTTGTLAAGVGHEINNPLTFIVANIDVALEELRATHGPLPVPRVAEVTDMLAEARTGAERIRNIVRGLRALARAEAELGPTDVRAALTTSRDMAMHEVRSRATLSTELSDVPNVLADETRLSQVFVNLIVNAAQAFETSDPRRNVIRVSARTADDGRALVEISDNGPGIPPEVLPRIFDPFFTTKAVGRGTGLGLAMCHSIVTELGGEILCETEVGVGTTFRVILPRASEGPAPVRAGTAPPALAPRGRVLLIDDDESVLHAIARLIAPEHDVVEEADAAHALTRLEEGERFDAVLCDLVMPGISGVELYRRAIARHPEISGRFAFISGGVLPGEATDVLGTTACIVLKKPFDGAALRSAVRRLMTREPELRGG